ncbi:TPA: glycosyltransferase [Escherichia coli]|uniref:glycosyltransferase n=2 Tax=Enterobacteriaceae TaxID=543 RepID=UPI0037553326|nr:glycosyltransferase family 2 protein [Escherichia coli]
MNVLQNVIFPSDQKFSDESLYFHCDTGHFNCIDGCMDMQSDTVISFASYYNYFSTNTWFNNSEISGLKLGGYCVGSAKIEVFCKSHNAKEFLVKRFFIESLDGFFSFDLGGGGEINNSLYLKVYSNGEFKIKSMFFYIDDEPKNEVKLGIVITHYNRKKYVLPAIKRIADELLSNAYFKGKVELIVVDNSSNITNEESHGCTVIPNKNLGGSGGFTRGLIYLKDNGFSHCLFMDDDATCEIESIKRAYNILQYSHADRLAISGGMLYEHRPTVLHEKGAKFKKLKFTPLKNGTDVSVFNNVLTLDAYPEKISYGAWWFFAFKISDITSYPFPFFVKADDMLFGLMNKFKIISPNGICVWGEDFGYKDGPMQRYLGTRGTFAASVISNDSSRMMIPVSFMKSIIAMLLSYRYSSAEAVYAGLLDYLKGPDYWVNNMEFDKILPSLSTCINGERSEKIDLYEYDITHKSIYESRFRRLVRLLTANGMLLPGFMIKNRIVLNDKNGVGVFRIIFRSRSVLYYHADTSSGFIATIDRCKFFTILFKSSMLALKAFFVFGKLSKEYELKSKEIMKESFWRKVYNK